MNDTNDNPTRDDYLRRLDDAMRDLPHGVAAEIRAGVTEELAGLDATQAAQRIADLGDPADIARGARDELPGAPVIAAPLPAPAAPKPPVTQTRGFAIVAALALSFGGFVVPGVGWVVGAVLVLLSSMWRLWEKAVAILVPLAALLLVVIVGSAMWMTTGEVQSGSASGTSAAPDPLNNPLVPGWYEVIWLTVVVGGLLLIPASGLWLLWRMRGRAAS